MVTYRSGDRNETEIEIDDTHNLREIVIFLKNLEVSVAVSTLSLRFASARAVSFAPAQATGR